LTISVHGFAQKTSDNKVIVTLSADLNYALLYDGHVQVREKSFEGSYLKLKENLGMDSWISVGGTIGMNFSKKNIFEFVYTRHYFEGTGNLSNPTWFNGALYAANSKADIHKTVYRGFEWIWKARIYNTPKTDFYFRTSIHYERLKFYVDAPVDENSPMSEIYEGFSRQQLPLPSFGIALNHEITQRWSLTAEVFASYLPTIRTWMQEGGTMYLAQSNVDARLNLLYHFRSLSICAGIWFKHYRVKEESREDENVFLLNGIGDKISVLMDF